jgi:hypothetical protein
MDEDVDFDKFNGDVVAAITRWIRKAYDMGYAKGTVEVLTGLTHPKHSLSGTQAQQVIFGDVPAAAPKDAGTGVGVDGRDDLGKPVDQGTFAFGMPPLDWLSETKAYADMMSVLPAVNASPGDFVFKSVSFNPIGREPPEQAVLWSTERDALLSREIGVGLPNTVIQDHLNAMAGGWIDVAALRNRMIDLKISRPRAKLPEKPKQAPIAAPHTAAREKALVPTPLSLPPPGPDGKVGVTRAELDAWCGKMRMKFDGGNMDRINALRAQLRQPPFVLVS